MCASTCQLVLKREGGLTRTSLPQGLGITFAQSDIPRLSILLQLVQSSD